MILVLVTGAGGFLGQRLVLALRQRGLRVRALDAIPLGAELPDGVEGMVGDVCDLAALQVACRGAACVVHLAARLTGPDAEVLQVAEAGTRRLLEAMATEHVPHLVLASSLSVYAASTDSGLRDEEAPLEQEVDARDAYTRAKLAQERIARERAGATGITLTVLRPGMLWGPGRADPPTMGFRLGRLRVLVEPSRQLPLVHVDNCADAFAAAVVSRPAGSFDVIDDPAITVDRFARDRRRRSHRLELALPAPYRPLHAAMKALTRVAPAGLRRRLPAFAGPARFAARYGPVQVPGRRFREQVGWTPPRSYEECLRVTFGAG